VTLIEREEHLSKLSELLDQARNGAGSVVVVRGEVGSGRTALLQQFGITALRSKSLVLHAVGSRAERALPLGVIGQLFRNAPLGAANRARVGALLDECALTAALHAFDPGSAELAGAPGLAQLAGEILKLVSDWPVVVAIDDARYADDWSLQCLTFLTRRVASAKVLVVLTDNNRSLQSHALFSSEVFAQSHCHRIELPLLSHRGIARLLVERHGEHLLPLTDRCHYLSGGNPLLVRGLMDDQSAALGAGHLHRLVIGNNFAEAVLTCLYRCDRTLLECARGLAIMDGRVLLDLLVDTKPEVVAQAVAELEAVGLLEDGQFRHPAIRAAVLDSLTPEERTSLHLRAAALLHANGDSVETVAEHLLSAGNGAGVWSAEVLRSAGESALQAGDHRRALACLRLADRLAQDDRQQAGIRAVLSSAEWQIDPARAARRLPGLLAAMRRGLLSGQEITMVAVQLLWHGQISAAEEAIGRLADNCDFTDTAGVESLSRLSAWLDHMYPELPARLSGAPELALQDEAVFSANVYRMDPASEGVGLGDYGGVIREAEQQLHHPQRYDLLPGLKAAALGALVYNESLDRASMWCVRLIDSTMGEARVGRAVYTVMNAAVFSRRGDLLEAEAEARAGMAMLSVPCWGMTVGLPIAVLVMVLTRRGDLEGAATLLAVNVPVVLFDTPLGLQYLNARGTYYLAVGNAEAALADFERCGELAARWRRDKPAALPWRSGAAAACRWLGHMGRARRYCEQELALTGPDSPRAWGTALRGLAASQDRPDPAMMQAAIDVLERSADRYQLAQAYADLARLRRVLGEDELADAAERRADALFERCGVKTADSPDTPWPLVGVRSVPEETYFDKNGDAYFPDLSNAQHRVAELAARGRTNREIASTLCVTVSTVEQHLTRVYRKLGVNGRSGLARLLSDGLVA
jgi:DNA-binding NarL/FixJ family response regulator